MKKIKAIKLEHVSKNFGKQKLLQNINLNIPFKSFVYISGKSGAGKTTLIKIISGIDNKIDGNIYYDNKNISKIKKSTLWANDISFVFQNYLLLEEKTVYQNLKILRNKVSKLDIENVLAKVDLPSSMMNAKVYTLSGGEKQRVGIARAMLKPFSIIIADEPTGNLDKNTAKTIMKVLKRINEEGKTVIVVSHDNEFSSMASKNLVIENGKLIEK